MFFLLPHIFVKGMPKEKLQYFEKQFQKNTKFY